MTDRYLKWRLATVLSLYAGAGVCRIFESVTMGIVWAGWGTLVAGLTLSYLAQERRQEKKA